MLNNNFLFYSVKAESETNILNIETLIHNVFFNEFYNHLGDILGGHQNGKKSSLRHFFYYVL